jgi:acetyl esterase/lipase
MLCKEQERRVVDVEATSRKNPRTTVTVNIQSEISTVHRIVFAVSLLVVSCITIPAFAAEPIVIDLWPGKPPADVGLKEKESSRIIDSPLVGPTKLISNVTKPTLTIYQAPWDKNTGTAMIICPGGGYWDLYWELEGEEVAQWLNSVGMTGIILKYRCPRRPGDVRGEPPLGPQLDAQRAFSLVRSRAAEWGIDPKRIGMVGFSAGGASRTGHSYQFREAVVRTDRRHRPSQLPARFRRPLLFGLSEGQGQG